MENICAVLIRYTKRQKPSDSTSLRTTTVAVSALASTSIGTPRVVDAAAAIRSSAAAGLGARRLAPPRAPAPGRLVTVGLGLGTQPGGGRARGRTAVAMTGR